MKRLLIALALTLFLTTPALAQSDWEITHVSTNTTFTFTFPYEVAGLLGYNVYKDGELFFTIPPDVDRVERKVDFVYGRATVFTMTAFNAEEEGLHTVPFSLRPPIPAPASFNVSVDFGQ